MGTSYSVLDYLTFQQASTFLKVTPEMFVMRPARSPYINTLGHIILILICVASSIGFLTWQLQTFATTPDSLVFSKRRAADVDPIPLVVSVFCSNPSNCGDIVVTSNYTSFSSGASQSFSTTTSAKCGASGLTKFVATAATASEANKTANTFALSLCFTGDAIFSASTRLPLAIPGLTVDFAAVNPGQAWVFVNGTKTTNTVPQPNLTAYGVVEIYDGSGTTALSSDGSDASSSSSPSSRRLLRVVTLDSWQIKSAVVTETIYERYGWTTVSTTASGTRVAAVQYEGKRPNWRASLVIEMARFVDIETSTQVSFKNAIFAVTGSCGILFIVSTVFNFAQYFLRRVFPGPAQRLADDYERRQRERERETKAEAAGGDAGAMMM